MPVPKRPTTPEKGVSINFGDMTLEQLEKKLEATYDDPVQSRLLEAARAQMIFDRANPQRMRADVDCGIYIQCW